MAYHHSKMISSETGWPSLNCRLFASGPSDEQQDHGWWTGFAAVSQFFPFQAISFCKVQSYWCIHNHGLLHTKRWNWLQHIHSCGASASNQPYRRGTSIFKLQAISNAAFLSAQQIHKLFLFLWVFFFKCPNEELLFTLFLNTFPSLYFQ